MKYVSIAALAAALVAAGYLMLIHRSAAAGLPGRLSKHATIVLTKNGFVPSEVQISLGGSVTFSTDRDKPFWPASNSHPSHSIYPEFDPKHSIDPGDTWTFVFDRAGDWRFHDHLRSYFTGTVHVVQ